MEEKKKYSRKKKPTHNSVAMTIYLDEATLDYIDQIKDGPRGASKAALYLLKMGIAMNKQLLIGDEKP